MTYLTVPPFPRKSLAHVYESSRRMDKNVDKISGREAKLAVNQGLREKLVFTS